MAKMKRPVGITIAIVLNESVSLQSFTDVESGGDVLPPGQDSQPSLLA